MVLTIAAAAVVVVCRRINQAWRGDVGLHDTEHSRGGFLRTLSIEHQKLTVGRANLHRCGQIRVSNACLAVGHANVAVDVRPG
jgi:hypothetical protein